MIHTEEDNEMLQRHDRIINDDVLPRLKMVEDTQADFKRAQTSLELTVMKDGQETRSLLNRFVEHHFGIDKNKLEINERVTMKKLSSKEKITIGIIAAIASSGGLVAAIATLIEALK